MKQKFAALFLFLMVFGAAAAAQENSIEQYLNIRSSIAPTFSPDGKRIAYLTNETGTWQVWAKDVAGGKPVQLTSFEDNVSFVRWLPNGKGIVFGKAIGGDENTQFFWMQPDGTAIKTLTDDKKVRHNFGGISNDGKTIYYSSNKRNPNYFDIYAMEIDSEKETLIYQQDGPNSVAAVNSTGKKFIISRSGTELSSDNDLYFYDTSTKKEMLITPHTGSASYGNVSFLPDGKSLILATDEKGEFDVPANLRLKNAANSSNWSDANRELDILKGISNDVSSITTSDYGSMFAFVLNRDGFSELWLQGIETGGKPLVTFITGKRTKIDLPAQGIVGGVTFDKDQTKLAFSFSSSAQNNDIWICDLKTNAVSKITDSDRAGIDSASFVAPELIKYKTFDGREIPAWYYKPSVAGKAGPRSVRKVNTKSSSLPVIVSVHGGPESQERPGFNPLYQYYLSRGYGILATNVRGSTGYGKSFAHLDDVEKREDSVKDIAFAHKWLIENGGADPARIAIMGGSYGGYMTLAAITLYPDLWAAAVDTVGIVNWETFLKNTSGYRRRQREVEYGRLDRDIDFLRRVSPIRKIDRIKTPLFVIHGKNDPRVPYTEAEQVVKALRERDAVVEYKLFDDEGHGISKLKNRLVLYPLVADFLDKYMK